MLDGEVSTIIEHSTHHVPTVYGKNTVVGVFSLAAATRAIWVSDCARINSADWLLGISARYALTAAHKRRTRHSTTRTARIAARRRPRSCRSCSCASGACAPGAATQFFHSCLATCSCSWHGATQVNVRFAVMTLMSVEREKENAFDCQTSAFFASAPQMDAGRKLKIAPFDRHS